MSELPPRREITDPETLRQLAHPLRHRIMRHLVHGPANSTTLARALGESTGATSYHLRQMAKHGFVEEVPERSRGRQRWWRAVPVDLRFPRHSEQSADMRAVMTEMNRLYFAGDMEDFARFQLERADQGEWADALPSSRGNIDVTPAELMEFFDEYMDLLRRYQRPRQDTPPDARTVLVRFIAFPAPEPRQPPDEEAEKVT